MSPTYIEEQCQRIVDGYLNNIKKGHLHIVLPNGTEKHYGDHSTPRCITINNYRFFTRLATSGNLGLGESWMEHDWDTENLSGVLELFIGNMAELKSFDLPAGLARRFQRLRQNVLSHPMIPNNTYNIHAHYDLHNGLYQLLLDDMTMMYSSALFQIETQPLADAQLRKIRRLTELASIESKHHVLEIGCGWGGFAIETAMRTGCRVTGITNSEEQFKWAKARVIQETLQDQVEIMLCDYRHVTGSFDRIVSIEVLEAAGLAYYGRFFASCDRLLKPGGKVVMQAVCIPDQHYLAYRRNPDWLEKYILQGTLPSLIGLYGVMTKHSYFSVERLDSIGIHYAETLRRWRKEFESSGKELVKAGYDGMFQRKWGYFLSYCEAAFQIGFMNNHHIVLTRPGEPSS